MKLATYSPEVSRLRRVAKACAAGELSRSEYRDVRRKVIVGMTGEGALDEATRPRFLEETTVRRAIPLYRSTESAKRQPMLWFLLFCLLLVGLSVPAVGWGQVIPPVAERVKSGGDRYQVDSVVWSQSEELFNQDEVGRLLEDGLQELTQEGAQGQHGFSASELEEVGRFLNAIGVHDERTQLSVEDLEDLKALVAVQKNRRGLNVNQIERLAGRLQDYVRAQGYPLAIAYVPSQTIHDRTVQLEVTLGTVSDVLIADSSSGLSGDQGLAVANQLAVLKGKPVARAEVETQLNILNRNPAYSVQAGFRPGQSVGDTEVNVHVRREQDHQFAVQIDNHGVEDVGEERITLTAGHSDLVRSGDRLSVALNSSVESDGQQYGGLRYTTQGFDRTIESSLAYADVSLGGGRSADGLLFDSEVIDTRLFTRQRRSEFVYRAGWHDVDAEQSGTETTWFVGAGWQGHRLWDVQKIALNAEVGLRTGGVSQDDTNVDDRFWRIDGNAFAWMPIDVPKVSSDARLVMHTRWQWTTDDLSATQRFSASSARHNSGLPVGSLLTDSAVELGVAVRIPQKLGPNLGHWSLGLDTMFGEDNGSGAWQHLTTFAINLEADIYRDDSGVVSSTLKLGYPLSHKSNGVLDDDGAQVYWSLKYAR